MSVAGVYIKNKGDLYKALTKNGKKLPSATASCTTKSYLVKVFKGTVWVPDYEMVRARPCVDPPHKA